MAQTAGPAAGHPARRPRRDAARNRELLVQAATSAFRDDGFDVALDAIARRAGVGNATLYRHFPTRAALYDAVFSEIRDHVTTVLERHAGAADARAGITDVLQELFSAGPAGLELSTLAEAHDGVPPVLASIVDGVRATLGGLLVRAQEQGTVRADVDIDDLGLLLTSLKPVILAAADESPGIWRRHLVLLLDALRPQAPTPLPDPDSSPDERERVSRRAHDAR